MILIFFLIITIVLNQDNVNLIDSLDSNVKLKQLSSNQKILSLDSTNILSIQNELDTDSIKKEPNVIDSFKLDSIKIDLMKNDIFFEQLHESKLTLADAIIYDITLDTIETEIHFQSLFESFEFLDSLSLNDEYKRIEYNLILNASIDYYQNKSLTTDKLESPLSMALFKEKLDNFIYKQQLEEVEFVNETIEFIPGHIPLTFNSKVYKNVKYFSGNQGKKGVQLWLNRSQKFKEIMLPILEKEGVPPEIFYLCVIESGLNPLALSYAQASGPWQFISSTGKVYGLNKNWYVDERRDFIKSTYAAAKYLKDLKKIFDRENPKDENGQNWYLAFAAYNCGASRVLKEMKRSNSTNFWDLNRLPGQTRNYVPKILAFFLISKNPEKYGFNIINEPNLDWINKKIDKQISFQQISDITKIDIRTLQLYNPEIKRGILPPIDENSYYDLRLPKMANYESFDSLYNLLKEKKTEDFMVVEYVVKKGDNLSRIASKYRIKIQDITSMNKISDKKYLQPGQILQIPMQGYDEYMQTILSSNKTKKIQYEVKSGDTISELAERFRTSQKKIKSWNGIRNDQIYIGKKLIIYVPINFDESKYTKQTTRKKIYTVKRGDSLSRIGHKYKVSINKIKSWNNLKSNIIRPGQKLIIYTKH